MQTFIQEKTLKTPQGQEAQRILRKCVHCGFCTATCPTYQLLGDELDSPRGRIYLIKGLFEGKKADEKTRLHLDRCLTCRSCETTCPSGVDYGHLIDLGREKVDEILPNRSVRQRAQRFFLRQILPYSNRFNFFLKTGRLFKPVLPKVLAGKIPDQQSEIQISTVKANLQRKMIVLDGCVQQGLTPNTNMAAKKVLSELGIDLISLSEAGCCGSVDQHLAAPEAAKNHMRRNIDAWWSEIQAGAEAIVISASGCGTLVKEYAYHLRDDADYAEKARVISEKARDLLEVLEVEDLESLKDKIESERINQNPISCQVPCSLQHGQQLGGRLESLLQQLGFKLAQVKDAHLCCGSAGTYSILQKDLANELREDKLKNLQKGKPDYIVSANVGCQLFLQEKSNVPVKHWIELLAEVID